MQNAINFTSTELSNNDFHSSLFAKQTQHDVVASCTLPVDSLAWGNLEGNISCRAITSLCNQIGGIVLSKSITDRRRSFNEQSGASKPAHLTAATCMQHACNMPATYMQFAISTLLNQHRHIVHHVVRDTTCVHWTHVHTMYIHCSVQRALCRTTHVASSRPSLAIATWALHAAHLYMPCTRTVHRSPAGSVHLCTPPARTWHGCVGSHVYPTRPAHEIEVTVGGRRRVAVRLVGLPTKTFCFRFRTLSHFTFTRKARIRGDEQAGSVVVL